MRQQHLKLKRGKSTRAERIFAERLKQDQVPFRAKVIIGGREVDFLIGLYAIDIDGHEQEPGKNEMLVREGYTPIHINNLSVSRINIDYLKNYG